MSGSVGTMECPYCGQSTPHHHDPAEISGMVRGLSERLTVLANELLPWGFYSAMLRAYGTGYGTEAEKALRADLQQVVSKLAQVSA